MAPIRCSNKDAPSWFIYLVKECRFCMINRCNKVHTMTMGKRTTKNNWLLHKMLKIYIGHKDLEIRIELIKHNHGFQWRLAIFVVFFFPSFPSSLLNSALCIFSNCHSFSEEPGHFILLFRLLFSYARFAYFPWWACASATQVSVVMISNWNGNPNLYLNYFVISILIFRIASMYFCFYCWVNITLDFCSNPLSLSISSYLFLIGCLSVYFSVVLFAISFFFCTRHNRSNVAISNDATGWINIFRCSPRKSDEMRLSICIAASK